MRKVQEPQAGRPVGAKTAKGYMAWEAENPQAWAAERMDAYHRNEHGYPLSARQAGIVLGLRAKGVEGLVARGLLKRRWPNTLNPYHPEDLAEYLARLTVTLESQRRQAISA